MALFSLAQAREDLSRLLPLLDRIVELRAAAAELSAAQAAGTPSELGGLAEFKAMQAQLDEMLTQVQRTGVQLKGFAPLLLDFPGEQDGQDVLYCWLEGDRELAWYHRADLGFAGRRRLPD